MTLQEALQSGKKLNRERYVTNFEGYFTFEGFKDYYDLTDLDILATDWMIEPDAPAVLEVTEEVLAAAWNKARGTTTIGLAETSPFFKRLVATLKAG